MWTLRCFAFLAMTLLPAIAATQSLSSAELFNRGRAASDSNCVTASKFYFAYLQSRPTDLFPARAKGIEDFIADCERRIAEGTGFVGVKGKADDALTADEKRCSAYATVAIAQFQAQKTAQCRFTGPAWSTDGNYHFRWCLDQKDHGTVRSGTRQREMAINACTK